MALSHELTNKIKIQARRILYIQVWLQSWLFSCSTYKLLPYIDFSEFVMLRHYVHEWLNTTMAEAFEQLSLGICLDLFQKIFVQLLWFPLNFLSWSFLSKTRIWWISKHLFDFPFANFLISWNKFHREILKRLPNNVCTDKLILYTAISLADPRRKRLDPPLNSRGFSFCTKAWLTCNFFPHNFFHLFTHNIN